MPYPDPDKTFALWRPFVRLYIRTFARAGDEFAWALLTRKIQGNDLPAQEMRGAAPFPLASRPAGTLCQLR